MTKLVEMMHLLARFYLKLLTRSTGPRKWSKMQSPPPTGLNVKCYSGLELNFQNGAVTMPGEKVKKTTLIDVKAEPSALKKPFGKSDAV